MGAPEDELDREVSCYGAVEFCDRLNRFVENRFSAHTNRQYRLSSEAEWEYACRAGTTTPFHFGGTLKLKEANYRGNYTYADGPKGECREETASVGALGVANDFALRDMHGNVREWCADHHSGVGRSPGLQPQDLVALSPFSYRAHRDLVIFWKWFVSIKRNDGLFR